MSCTLSRPILTKATRRASTSADAFYIVPILGDPVLAHLLQLGVRIHVAAEITDNLTGSRMTLGF